MKVREVSLSSVYRLVMSWRKTMASRKVQIAVAVLLLNAVVVLFYQLGSYPGRLSNWEEFSVWGIFQRQYGEQTKSFFAMGEGLMTDSKDSPLIVLPAILLSNSGSLDLLALRFFNATLGIVTILVFFYYVRRYFSGTVAVIAAILLLNSQIFLVYMRTATIVGPSLLFSLVTMYLLVELWKNPRRYIYYGYILLSLAINSFLYAPIRFLLPLVVVVIVLRWFMAVLVMRRNAKEFALIYYTAVLSVVVFLLVPNSPAAAWLKTYYHARGEQVVQQMQDRGEFSAVKLAAHVQDKLTDLTRLVLNIDTRPTVTDYWNSSGQVISVYLTPLLVLGVLVILIKRKNRAINYLQLTWFFLMALPIILTNNVHAGRLYLSIAPMFILVAVGIEWVGHFLQKLLSRVKRGGILYGGVLAGLLLFVSFSEFSLYYGNPEVADSSQYAQRGGLPMILSSDIVLANFGYESLKFWEAFYYLSPEFQFHQFNQGRFVPINQNRSLGESAKKVYAFKSGAQVSDLVPFCQAGKNFLLIGNVPSEWDGYFFDQQCSGEVARW